VLLLTLRGTPFLYMGEELGLENAAVPPERMVDPGGRDGCRAPFPWLRAPGHGWRGEPWLPFPPDASARSVEAQREDPASVLHLYGGCSPRDAHRPRSRSDRSSCSPPPTACSRGDAARPVMNARLQ
jgi:glycosidase